MVRTVFERTKAVLDRLRELLSTECMVPSCSDDPDLYPVGGSVLLLCPEHQVEVELAKLDAEQRGER